MPQRVRWPLQLSDNSKTPRTAAAVAERPIAHRGLPRGRVPRAAAHDMVGAVAASGLLVVRRAGVAVMPAIGDPLLDIAQHVVNAERVGRETAHDRQAQRTIGTRGDVRLYVRFRVGRVRDVAMGAYSRGIIAEVVSAGSPGAGDIFPFCLARQAIAVVRALAQPVDISLRVLPGYAGHGK